MCYCATKYYLCSKNHRHTRNLHIKLFAESSTFFVKFAALWIFIECTSQSAELWSPLYANKSVHESATSPESISCISARCDWCSIEDKPSDVSETKDWSSVSVPCFSMKHKLIPSVCISNFSKFLKTVRGAASCFTSIVNDTKFTPWYNGLTLQNIQQKY